MQNTTYRGVQTPGMKKGNMTTSKDLVAPTNHRGGKTHEAKKDPYCKACLELYEISIGYITEGVN